jgi:tetratricopeptide (TPR) repeat protein
MDRFKSRTIILFLFTYFLLFHLSFIATADELPPDQEVQNLKFLLAANPENISGWIRLADLQRIMGYSNWARESLSKAAEAIKKLPKMEKLEIAGDYYTSRAWLEYEATNWETAFEAGTKAVKFNPNREARLVKALAMAAVPHKWEDVRPELDYLFPLSESGPANRQRNYYWVYLVGAHHRRESLNQLANIHVGTREQFSNWGELLCKRDHGIIYENNGDWQLAETFYELSVKRSLVGKGNWATRHDRYSPLQIVSDAPMPFWSNIDGGYVTGSLMAYTGYACEEMLRSGSPGEREKWAVFAGDGASRCLAVYSTQPWPWLWRALAWQVQGEIQRATSDLNQAAVEFEEIGLEDPLYFYAKGHELILKKNYTGSLPWLEKAVKDLHNIGVCWADLGLARAMSQNKEGALTAFDRAVELTPNSAVALHNRGMLHFQEGRTNEALADLTRAAEIAPQDQQIVSDLQRAKLAN